MTVFRDFSSEQVIRKYGKGTVSHDHHGLIKQRGFESHA